MSLAHQNGIPSRLCCLGPSTRGAVMVQGRAAMRRVNRPRHRPKAKPRRQIPCHVKRLKANAVSHLMKNLARMFWCGETDSRGFEFSNGGALSGAEVSDHRVREAIQRAPSVFCRRGAEARRRGDGRAKARPYKTLVARAWDRKARKDPSINSARKPAKSSSPP